MDLQNESINEIKEPTARGKLAGLQEMVWELDQAVLEARGSVREKNGVVSASDVIAKRLQQECLVINKKLDDELIPKEEARIRVNQTEALVAIVRSIAEQNRADMNALRGKIEGLQLAATKAGERFKNEAAKYERHQRMEAEEEEEAQALGRKTAKKKAPVKRGRKKKSK
jgi:hypothetical protein